MLEPHGPLPPEIYWRRRVLVAALAVLAVLLIVLLIVFVGGGKDSSQPTAFGSSSATTTEPTTGLPSSQPASGEPGYGGNNASGSAAASESGGAGYGNPVAGSVASGAPGASGAAGVPTPGAVVAGAPCPDTNISVVVTADKPSYAVGEQPTFEATVTNAGAVPCSRDIGTGQQQLLVLTLDGSRQLWSNFDCTFQPEIKNEVLAPGQQLRYRLQWAGTTSAPGCQTQRVPVAPGAYQVVAQMGAKRSNPVTFNVTRAAPRTDEPAPGG